MWCGMIIFAVWIRWMFWQWQRRWPPLRPHTCHSRQARNKEPAPMPFSMFFLTWGRRKQKRDGDTWSPEGTTEHRRGWSAAEPLLTMWGKEVPKGRQAIPCHCFQIQPGVQNNFPLFTLHFSLLVCHPVGVLVAGHGCRGFAALHPCLNSFVPSGLDWLLKSLCRTHFFNTFLSFSTEAPTTAAAPTSSANVRSGLTDVTWYLPKSFPNCCCFVVLLFFFA